MVLIRLDDVATRCKVSKRNVYEWVKKGIIVPVERDRPVNSGLVFNETDVANIELLFKENITVFAAAKKIGVPYNFINSWLEKNEISLEEEYIGAKVKHYLKVKWLEENQNNIIKAYDISKGKRRKRVGSGIELVLQGNGLRVFEIIEQNGEQLLVVNTKPIKVRNSEGIVNINLDSVLHLEPWNDAPYSANKGNIICRIPKNLAIFDWAYKAIHLLVGYIGTRNIRIFEEEELYVIVCRTGYIPKDKVIIKFLELYLQEGVYFEEEDQLLLGDIEVRLNIGISYSILGKLQAAAEKENISVQVFISGLADKWVLN